jgi:hypothetical protein
MGTAAKVVRAIVIVFASAPLGALAALFGREREVLAHLGSGPGGP